MDFRKSGQRFVFSVFFICLTTILDVSSGADKISGNDTLSGDQTIVSAGGVFELGFFRPGNTSNSYLGIWFNKVSEQTVVWVANREKPISDRFSSVLRISDGNLVLFDESKTLIWSSNASSINSGSVEAVLSDEGNFVLREVNGSNNTREVLWQSFDHPTDTWLPGMKIGYNRKTTVNQQLISWKNKEDPAPGLFSLTLDLTSGTNQYVLFWNYSEMYWASGAWTGQIFSNVPEMRLNYIYNYSFVSDDTGRYFVYETAPSFLERQPNFTSRFVIDAAGQLKQYYWLFDSQNWFQFWSTPRQPCEVYAYCGAFGSCSEQTEPFCGCVRGFRPRLQQNWNFLKDYSGGCVRKTALKCENGSFAGEKSDRFAVNQDVVLPEHSESVAVGSIAECERSCLSNCSCIAYAFENNACSMWTGELLGLQTLAQGHTDGKTIYIKLAASEFSSSKINKGMVIGVTVGSVIFVLLLGLVVIVYLRRKMRRSYASKAMDGSLVAFTFKDLQNATKNFSEKLGSGGFGCVFKGVLPDSTVIAVKKLESVNQGEKQFRTEVSTIGSIQHVNLVRLCGFCSEGDRKLLVYEYMSKGSVNSHLFDAKDSEILDWKTRYNIALGAARGLAYLHEKCRDCIIHCDIKPENILLDSEFGAKVADFGLAKLLGREFSRVLTTIRGTRGYLAPEWISGVAITAKADVYSYGMMLFEFVSGQRNSQVSDGELIFFPTLAVSKIAEGGKLLDLLDHRMDGKADVEELSRMLKVACWCVQDDENHRPSMGQVVQYLEGVLEVSQPPLPKALQVFANNSEQSLIFYAESSSNQSSETWKDTSNASSQAISSISSITS